MPMLLQSHRTLLIFTKMNVEFSRDCRNDHTPRCNDLCDHKDDPSLSNAVRRSNQNNDHGASSMHICLGNHVSTAISRCASRTNDDSLPRNTGQLCGQPMTSTCNRFPRIRRGANPTKMHLAYCSHLHHWPQMLR